jgi:hypothetical protein
LGEPHFSASTQIIMRRSDCGICAVDDELGEVRGPLGNYIVVNNQ